MGMNGRQSTGGGGPSGSRTAQSFVDLDVYQSAIKLSHRIFEVTKCFPREEMYALTDQIRRSARSIGANLAEAWSKRRYPQHFISKLTDADGELQETRHWIGEAGRCGYLDEAVVIQLEAHASAIGRMLGTMLSMADSFQPEPGNRLPTAHRPPPTDP